MDIEGYTAEANVGSSALFIAAKNGHAGTMKILLSAGAPVDQTNSGNVSPLIIGCWYAHLRAVEILLQAGASVDLVESKGSSTSLYVLLPALQA